MIVDSHCHLNIIEDEKLGGIAKIVETAVDMGVTRMMCVAINPSQWSEVLAITEQFPEVYATVGVHPCEDKSVVVTDEEIIAAAHHPKVLAIGEVGLDYFHFEDEEDMRWQHERFRQHIRVAKQLDKPLVIHTRNSTPDCLSILEEEGAEAVKGIMHCFVEDIETAKRAMDLGFYISFSGIVTFKNAKDLKEVAKQIPLDRILVETDSPYLAPTPFRGKTNQPGYTRFVVEEIAELKGLSFDEVADATTRNFETLFKLD